MTNAIGMSIQLAGLLGIQERVEEKSYIMYCCSSGAIKKKKKETAAASLIKRVRNLGITISDVIRLDST
jgi:hypothetical protein